MNDIKHFMKVVLPWPQIANIGCFNSYDLSATPTFAATLYQTVHAYLNLDVHPDILKFGSVEAI